MGNIEEKAKEFAIARYGSNGAPMTTQNEMAKVQACAVGYRDGWNEALKSQWVKPEKYMPNMYQEVFAMIIYNGIIQIHSTMYFGDKNWCIGDYPVIAWMEIPSYEHIIKGK